MMLLLAIVPWVILLRTCLGQQDFLNELPQCAVLCFEASLPTTTCPTTDISCLCSDTLFIDTAAACNAVNCTVVETLESTAKTYAACGIPTRDQGIMLTGIGSSFMATAGIMVIMRLIDRYTSPKANLGWDDLLIALAGLAAVVMTTSVLLSVQYGFGTDIWGLTPDQITRCLESIFVAYPFYMITEAFCQLSILAFYLRFMVDQKMLLIVKGLMLFVTAFGITNTICMIFQVWPINYFWNGWKGEMVSDTAINLNLFSFVRGGIEIGLDLGILVLPLPMLAKLHVSITRKMQLLSMFCVGFCITGVSCARLHSLVQFAKTQNATYDNTPTIYWCLLEADLFIIVACMPAIHAAVHRVWLQYHPAPTDQYDRSDANSYFNRSKRTENSITNQTEAGINKVTEVNVFRTNRDDASDVELVERPSYLKMFDQKTIRPTARGE